MSNKTRWLQLTENLVRLIWSEVVHLLRAQRNPADGAGGTELHATRIATAEIAFDRIRGDGVEIDVAKGTGDHAHPALDADFVLQLDGPGIFVPAQSAGGTDGGAGRGVTLETEEGSVDLMALIFLDHADVDTGFAQLSLLAAVRERAGEFA